MAPGFTNFGLGAKNIKLKQKTKVFLNDFVFAPSLLLRTLEQASS
ncbi:hypothetical protein Calag_0563 [Caldisphaera lagunensis DSM 15908]|uniref:Uncharacterized protein n=1 Tax=Caldisphaera lagunensis (strain DSM 15908 / JCM 11604 / ANMR 0165 / IC-154) TaxID=1056495 RepID=L0AB08_CALLD|nr:hypothetical protein Calag_0563 [Caldisphaera lagunensis DSM 15908]